MKQEDIKNAPKLFCETVQVGFTQEFFVAALTSGQQASVFAFSPEHTKRLAEYLTYQVADYERQHGTIETKWEPNIPSPITDIKPPREGS
jgi:hypothetical protein